MDYVRTGIQKTEFERQDGYVPSQSLVVYTPSRLNYSEQYVDYCIDPTYNVGGCPNFCASKSSEATVQLTPCTGRADSDRWCCGISKDRCTMNIRVLLRPQVFSGDSSVSQSASLSPTVASTSTESSAPTGSTEPAVLARQRLSGGAIAGIVIGTTVGLILLGTVMFTARRGIRRTGPEPTAIVREPMSKQPEIELDGAPKHVYVNELPGARPSNLPGVGPVELERR